MWHLIEKRRQGRTVLSINRAEFETLSMAKEYREVYFRMHGVWLHIVDESGVDYKASISANL